MRQAITVGLCSFICSLLCLLLIPAISHAESYGGCAYGSTDYNTNSCSASSSPNSTAGTTTSGASTSASPPTSGSASANSSTGSKTGGPNPGGPLIVSPPAPIPSTVTKTHTNWNLLTGGIVLIALAAGTSIWFALGRRKGSGGGTPFGQPPGNSGTGF